MRELILGNIPDNYNPERHHVTGAWCFFNNQDLLEKYNSKIPNTSLTKQEYSNIEEETSDLLTEYLPFLTKLLNESNNCNFSTKFWKIMLGDWFISLTSNFLEKKYRLNKISCSENYTVKVVQITNKEIFTSSTNFFKSLHMSNDYNSYLLSEAISILAPTNLHISSYIKHNFSSPEIAPGYKDTLKQKITSYIRSRLRIESIFGFNVIQLLILSIILSIKSFLSTDEVIASQTHIRNKNKSTCSDYPWADFYKKNLPKEFSNINKFEGGNKIFTKGMFICSNFKAPTKLSYRIGLMRENNMSIFSSQHGCCYGDLHSTPRNNLMELSLDGFFTWGWRSHGPFQKRPHPMPSPMLSKLKLSYKNSTNKTFIALTSSVFAPFNLSSLSGYDSYFVNDYGARIISIIDTASPEVLEMLYYRPRMTHRNVCFSIHERVISRFPNIKILKGDLDKKIISTKLIIIDNPGSVLNKALGSNIPTLICWNSKCWLMSDAMEKHLNIFKELSVFFEDPILMTKHLNTIAANINDWWDQEKIQNAIHDFNQEFALTSNTPFFDWAKYLLKM